ncbi:phenylacetate--CoA ligase family protein [Pseudoalteromonas luteoviolacea]|uniref:phenylacetate--CoA ligase family protein n=1 Tax=Pseudoalteromonas luteoviolacea TaxID=43657 RepID=UPI001B3A2DAC|nr:phenylacetate--CoA ligase family protein [Pseudoalteromonas luteoviolacea]MBQ4878632.1 phenylacetate--CoA ligase family protein [Pseudoalteromonas luteoviolacea]MBQ4907172.1 phenylacetate--CoA ligase family protein [Pseudoalteromonas luteoviolacea]
MKNLQAVFAELKYAYEQVPFYKALLDAHDIDLSTEESYAQFQKIPFTEKKDYRVNFPKGVIARDAAMDSPLICSHRSSGSSGERLITLEIGLLLFERALQSSMHHPAIFEKFLNDDRTIARYAAPNCSDVECANPNSTIEDRTLAEGTVVLPVYHDFLTTSENMIDRTIAEIAQISPDLFYVDPTYFAFLLREYKKRGLKPPQIPVLSSYTAATSVAKRQIAEFYDMSSQYSELLSSTEFGWVASECPHGTLHLNEEAFFMELVPMTEIPREDQGFSELVISSIDNGVCPHIRYKTGDVVTLIDTPCSCGSEHRGIVMHGRLSSFIYQKGTPLYSPKEIDWAVGSPNWLDQFQLEQLSDDMFQLKLMANEHYQPGMHDSVLDNLHALFNFDCSIEVTICDYIPAERSGKFNFVKGVSL